MGRYKSDNVLASFRTHPFALVELIKLSNRLISSDSIHPQRYLVNELISPIFNPCIFACTYFRDIFAST